jgi:hypothetical protein
MPAHVTRAHKVQAYPKQEQSTMKRISWITVNVKAKEAITCIRKIDSQEAAIVWLSNRVGFLRRRVQLIVPALCCRRGEHGTVICTLYYTDPA